MTDQNQNVAVDDVEAEISSNLLVMSRSLAHMFNIPLHMDIFEFSAKWMLSKASSRKNFDFTHPDDIYHVARMSITPVTSVVFDSEEPHLIGNSVEDGMLDSFYYMDREYTYGDLLTGLYFANMKIANIIEKKTKDIDKDYLDVLIDLTEDVTAAWMHLRIDSVKSILSPVAMDTIATVAVALDSLIEVEEEGEEVDEND